MLKYKSEFSFIISMVASCFLTAAIFFGQVNLLDSSQSLEFEGDSELVLKLFEDDLLRTTEIVKSLQAFYIAQNGEVTREQFESFCRTIQEGHPHIRALEWVPIISEKEKASWEEYIRSEGYPNFQIFEKEGTVKEAAVGRKHYYPVSFIYPMEGNRAAHGFDLGSNEKRKSAIIKSLSQEKTVATAPVTLVQDKGSSAAVLLFLPVYDKGEAQGLVLAVVEAARYLPKDVHEYLNESVKYRLVDESSSEVMSSNIKDEDFSFSYEFKKGFPFGGRRWSLSFYSEYQSPYLSIEIWAKTLAVFLFLMILIMYLFKFKNYAEEVAEEVEHKTLEIQEARNRAEEANRAKSSFLANMSHEIRTPMTAILGYVDYLKDSEVDEEELYDSFRVIRHNGEHLLSIINDILDLSKIEALKMSVSQESISPFEVCQDAFELFSSQHSKRGIDLRFKPSFPLPACILSDSVRVKQILLNLLSNALKFTKEGFVELRVNYDEKTKTLTFAVEDTGIGMTLEQQRRVFQAFEQANNNIARQFGGTGLGMMISSKLAELLGAELDVTSLIDKGTTFSLSFQLLEGGIKLLEEKDYQSKFKFESVKDVSAFEGKVLIVEDNVTNQKLLTKVLQKKGLEVDSAFDGLEGVEKVRENRYDLVFMDMQMPKMDGQTAFKKIREFNELVPIVALTANAFDSDRDECLNLGFNAFVSKPVNTKTLTRVLSEYLD